MPPTHRQSPSKIKLIMNTKIQMWLFDSKPFPSNCIGVKRTLHIPWSQILFSQLMLVGLHKSCVISSLVYFPITSKIHAMIVIWPQIFSPVIHFKACNTVTLSCFYTPCVWCTWGVRFVIGRSKSSRALFKYYDSGFFLAILRFCLLLLDVYSPSFVYSARILEEFHLIRLDLSPTLPSLYTPRDRR